MGELRSKNHISGHPSPKLASNDDDCYRAIYDRLYRQGDQEWRPIGQLGCANAVNLGLMVANPADLATGRPLAQLDARRGAVPPPAQLEVERHGDAILVSLRSGDHGLSP